MAAAHNLTIRSEIDEERKFTRLMHPRSEDSSDNIATEIPADVRQAIKPCVLTGYEAYFSNVPVRRFAGYRSIDQLKVPGILVAEEVNHHRVSGNCYI